MAIHLVNNNCVTISGINTLNPPQLNNDAYTTFTTTSTTGNNACDFYTVYPYASSGTGASIGSPYWSYKITGFPIDFDSLEDDAEVEVIIKGVKLKIAKKKFLEFFKKFFSEELIVGLLLRD